jgi:hypothetical protein
MNKTIISLALGASALFATAAAAAPLVHGLAVIPDNGFENVRMVCNEYGRCWRERGQRRVIVEDSYNYAPRERYIERRGYNDGGYYNNGPSVGIGVGPGGVGIGFGAGPRWWGYDLVIWSRDLMK